MRILGIETSCDETAAAVVGGSGVLSDVISTQIGHAAFGGVVPEIAAREHIETVSASVREALRRAQIDRPDAVAVTSGPGLVGALLVGISVAQGLAATWDVPLIGVNHLEGHLLSPLLEDPRPSFPFLALVVSGGHTTLYLAQSLGKYRILGQTVDDAAGEAYDKVARLLGLGYPGGPLVDALAAKGRADAVALPRPMEGQLDLSFSGLKTAVRQQVMGANRPSDEDLCASFQAAVIDVLVSRIRRAARETGVREVAVAGGVAANAGLRAALAAMPDVKAYLPPRARCTDNAAMIAHVGRLHLLAGREPSLALSARPSWPVGD